jgi:hypothetical protein
MVYLRAESVLFLAHYFASKSCAAVSEAFSSTYPDREVPKKTTIHRLLTKFRDTGSVCLSAEIMPTGFKRCISCNNGIRLQEFSIAIGLVVLGVKGFMCSG